MKELTRISDAFESVLSTVSRAASKSQRALRVFSVMAACISIIETSKDGYVSLSVSFIRPHNESKRFRYPGSCKRHKMRRIFGPASICGEILGMEGLQFNEKDQTNLELVTYKL